MNEEGRNELDQMTRQQLLDRIAVLEQELRYYRQDGLLQSYYALNYQLNRLNEVIMSANIDLSAPDKQFERFWKILTEIHLVHTSITNLKAMLEAGKDKEEDGKEEIPSSVPFIEKLILSNTKNGKKQQ